MGVLCIFLFQFASYSDINDNLDCKELYSTKAMLWIIAYVVRWNL